MKTKRSYVVYKHINRENGKIYIGITSDNPKRRWGSSGINYRYNKHFYGAIQKYGWDNFEHIILFDNLTKEEACEIEKELISFHNSTNPDLGYNNSIGGELTALGTHRIVSEQELARIREMNCKPIICLNDLSTYKSAREAESVLHIDYRYISRVLTGKAKSCHGFVFMFLKDYDKNKKYKLDIRKDKKVICLESGVIYKNAREIYRQLGIHHEIIRQICLNNRDNYKGLHFKYYIGE